MLHLSVKLCQSDAYSCGTDFFLSYEYFTRRKSRILSVEKFCEMLRKFFHRSILQDFIPAAIFSQNFGRLETFLLK